MRISRLSNQGSLFPLFFYLVIHFSSLWGDGFWASPGASLVWVPVLGAGLGPPDCLDHLLVLYLEQSQVAVKARCSGSWKALWGPQNSSGSYIDPSGGLRRKSTVGEMHDEDGDVSSMLTDNWLEWVCGWLWGLLMLVEAFLQVIMSRTWRTCSQINGD